MVTPHITSDAVPPHAEFAHTIRIEEARCENLEVTNNLLSRPGLAPVALGSGGLGTRESVAEDTMIGRLVGLVRIVAVACLRLLPR